MIFNLRIINIFFFILTVSLLQLDGFLFNKKTTSTVTTVTTTTTPTTTSISPKVTPRSNLSTIKSTISARSPNNKPSKLGAYKVTKVLDGDTVYAKSNIDNKEIKIRFRCVDAPEKSQEPWGPKSINKLLSILPVNSEINLNKTSIDLYGRTLAEIISTDGVNINRKMVESGMAVYYPFQSGCKEFQDLESIPKKNKVGVWSDSNFELPWDYRRREGIGKIGHTTNKNHS